MEFSAIVLPSIGPVSVGSIALMISVYHAWFFLKNQDLKWSLWGAGLALTALAYSLAVVVQYNTQAGPLNYLAEKLQYTAIVCMLHAIFGFGYAFLKMPAHRYHIIGGAFHLAILIALWRTDLLISKEFITRDFSWIDQPYIEPLLQPLGMVMLAYVALAAVYVLRYWLTPEKKNSFTVGRRDFMFGLLIWGAAGVHDALATVGFKAGMFLMEYGFLGFTLAVFSVTIKNYNQLHDLVAQREKKLAAEKDRLHVTIRAIGEGFIAADLDGRVALLNEVAEKMTGWPQNEAEGKPLPEVLQMIDIHGREITETIAHDILVLHKKGGRVPDVGIIDRNGRECPVSETHSPIYDHEGRTVGMVVICRDMTESRKAEESIRKSEEWARTLLHKIQVAVLVFDSNLKIVTNNKAASDLFGLDEDKLSLRTAIDAEWNFIRQDGARLLQEENPVYRALTSGEKIRDQIIGRRRSDHEEIWLIANADPMVDEQKRVSRIIVTFIDITPLIFAENALKESEENFRLLVEDLPETIYETDALGNLTYMNARGFDVFGIERHEMEKGIGCLDLLEPQDHERALRNMHKALKGIHTGLSEYTAVRRDGAVFPILIRSTRIVREGRTIGLRGFIVDITQRKQYEEGLLKLNAELEKRVAERTARLEASMNSLKQAQKILVRSEKMAALGSLVAGMAHEINTPIGIGYTASSYLKDQSARYNTIQVQNGSLTKSETDKLLNVVAESANIIFDNMARAAELINSFKMVAVDQSNEQRRRFNVKEYLDELLLSLRPKYKRTAHTIRIVCPEGLVIYSYPGVFSQIFTNLIMNSLIHGFEHVKQGEIVIEFSMDGNHLDIVYRDNGQGMNEKTLVRIFDPFFTTKRNRGGSGLGMHIVYNLVTRTLNGEIDCRSAPGQGTEFRITVPIRSDIQSEIDPN